MIDNKTDHLLLPLPHGDNQLQDDVLRLRAALTAIDALLYATRETPIELPAYLADGTYAPMLLSRHE